jgi:hypothetical protein
VRERAILNAWALLRAEVACLIKCVFVTSRSVSSAVILIILSTPSWTDRAKLITFIGVQLLAGWNQESFPSLRWSGCPRTLRPSLVLLFHPVSPLVAAI